MSLTDLLLPCLELKAEKDAHIEAITNEQIKTETKPELDTLIEQEIDPENNSQPFTSTAHDSITKNVLLLPGKLRPFEKLEPRKESTMGRKKIKSAILTDSPVRSTLQKKRRGI